jgi:hypothetical protein
MIIGGNLEIGGSGAGNGVDGIALAGGNIEMRNANPFIDFKASNIDFGARIIYDYNVADGLEFVGATQYKFDNELYNTGIIRTDSYLQAVGSIYTNGGTIYVGYGTSWDTNLYRAAADSLKTDDHFRFRNLISGTTSITTNGGVTAYSVTVSNISPTCTGTVYELGVATTTVPGETVKGASATSGTSSSVIVWCARSNTTATNVHWVLIGM